MPGRVLKSQVSRPQISPFRPHSEHEKATQVLGPSPRKISAHLAPTLEKQYQRRHTPGRAYPTQKPASGRMRRTGEGRKPSKTRRHPYSGHILGKASFPRRGEEVPGNVYVTSLPGEKQGKRPSALWRASVSNPNFRFVSRFRSPPLTSGRLGFRCARFLRPLLPVPPRSR